MSLLDRVRLALAPAYDLEREVGAGGMGTVFRAHDPRLNRTVAIKVLHPALATAAATERFIREARALAKAAHPNVVVVHDVMTDPGGRDGLFYFVMEYLDGETLHHRLARGRLGRDELRRLGGDLLAGLTAAHAAGLVHRDIKPANIFLAGGRAKLGDFGIAREVAGGESSSTGDEIVGTPDYLAPEQRRGGSPDRRSDIYQAASVLYEAATGRRWISVEADPDVALRAVPRRLRRVLRRGLAWEPSERWPDAGSFRQAFLESIRPAGLTVGQRVIGVAIAAVALWAIVGPPKGEPSPPPPVDLTVLHFRGADSAEALRLARYTSEPLNRFPRVTTRPLTVALGVPWPRTPEELARLNTRYYSTGELRGDTLVLDVYRGDGRPAGRMTVPREASSLTSLVWGRAAADSIIRRFFPQHYVIYHSVAGQGGSDDALAVDEFLLGEDAWHHDEYRLAEQHYRNAIDRDRGFAMAGWQLLFARRALRETSSSDVVETLDRYGASLPELYRSLLEVMVEEDLPTRFARYRALVASYPQNRFARMLYADDLVHLGPLIGLPLDTALSELQRAAAIDPHRQLGPEQDHTIWLNLRLGREKEAWAAFRRRQRTTSVFGAGHTREGGDRTKFWRLALYERFTPWKARAVRWWFYLSPDSTRLRQTQEYMRLALAMDIPACQLGLGAVVSRHALDDRGAGLGHEAQGLALVALGRPGAALAQFDSAAARFGSAASRVERAEWSLLLPVLGVPLPPALAGDREQDLHFALADSVLAPRAAWSLAVAALSRGDPQPEDLLAVLQRRAARDPAADRLSRLLEALVAAEAGRLEQALALSDTLIRFGPVTRLGAPFARAVLYARRAEWQVRLGRPEEAIRTLRWVDHADLDGWAQGEAQAYDVDLSLSPYMRVRLAGLLWQQGREALACATARRVTEIWEEAEPALDTLRDSLVMSLKACTR